MLRRKIIIARFVQVAGPDMAFRDAVTFEIAVAGLCQSKVRVDLTCLTLGYRSNHTEKVKESA